LSEARQTEILETVFDSTNNVLKTSATINASDIQLGAVEIKNATTDTRMIVNADGSINVENTTHDNLNLNANIQVGNADASNTNQVPVKTYSVAFDNETLTIGNTAGGVALTAAVYLTATRAVITVETAAIRFWVGGTAPTVSSGHLLNIGDPFTLDSAEDIASFRAINAVAGVSGTIQVTYST
jgi:hypothetical protein